MPRRSDPDRPKVVIWTSATRHKVGAEVRTQYGKYEVAEVKEAGGEWEHRLERK